MMNWQIVRLMAEMSKNESFMTALKQSGLKIDWKAIFDPLLEGVIVADTPLDTPDTLDTKSDVPAPVPENPSYPFLTATVTKNSLAQDIADLQEATSAGSFLGKMLDVIARLEERSRPIFFNPLVAPYPPTAWPEPFNPYYPEKPSDSSEWSGRSEKVYKCNASENPVSDATGDSETL